MPALDLWDCWPLQYRDGAIAEIDGTRWWFFLSAPRFDDPGLRHDAAQIRLIAQRGAAWIDYGVPIDADISPGSREWAGSALLEDDGLTVWLYFTATGRRGEAPTFEQRLFEMQGVIVDGRPADWQSPRQIVESDGRRYMAARELAGRPGAIKAFRDPAFFNDPATGLDHIIFTASAGWDADAHNGVVGLATRRDGRWQLDDPLIEAVGVNNELERAHVHVVEGRYYLFWSTQRHTFSDKVTAGPNGLYAMTAPGLRGPWVPVNGSGLVAANPPEEPSQTYSWWVVKGGDVIAFVDHWGMAGRTFTSHPETLRGQFGGTPAPLFSLIYDGLTIRVRDAPVAR